MTREMFIDLAYVFDLKADYILDIDNEDPDYILVDIDEEVKRRVAKESSEYEQLLCLYKLLGEKPRKQLLAIARLLST